MEIEMKETQIENTFTIKLTKTMLNKSTIAASKVVKDWYFYALEGNFGENRNDWINRRFYSNPSYSVERTYG